MQKSPILLTGRARTVEVNSSEEHNQVITDLVEWFKKTYGRPPTEVGLSTSGRMMDAVRAHAAALGLRISPQRQPDKHVFVGGSANTDTNEEEMETAEITNSGHIHEIAWEMDNGKESLTVTFMDGGQYRYSQVPYTVYRAIVLLNSENLGGQFFRDAVRDNYTFTKLRGKTALNGVTKTEDIIVLPEVEEEEDDPDTSSYVQRGLYGVYVQVEGDELDDFEAALEIAIEEMEAFAEERIQTLDEEDKPDWDVENWGIALPPTKAAKKWRKQVLAEEKAEGEENGTIFFDGQNKKLGTIYVGLNK